MTSRRHFLISSATLPLASLLTSCGSQRLGNSSPSILVLEGSISPQVLKAFRQEYPDVKPPDFKPVEQLKELFDSLTKYSIPPEQRPPKRWPWQRTNAPMPPDLVTLGNGWLPQAIAADVLQPLPLDEFKNWSNLPEPWLSLIQDQQKTWGIPYRWGTTLLLYRKDKLKNFDWTLTDWSDLWRPELRGHLSLLNHPREVIGFTLKKMGYSYNESAPETLSDLPKALATLHRNVKFYSSTHYLQPLTTGDTWVAQAWSADALPLMKRYPNLAAVVPVSGTALWCDLWVRPKLNTRPLDSLRNWVNFCGDRTAVTQFAQSTHGASPLIYELLPPDSPTKQNPLIYLDPAIFAQSELIQPLPPTSEQQYLTLWQTMRQR